MKLKLDRRFKGNEYTIGSLYIDGVFFCDTLEDVDRGLKQNTSLDEIKRVKVQHKTAIPRGEYEVTLKVKSPRFSQKEQYKFCEGYLPRLKNVPGFDGILIHIGNKPEHSSGCILVGENKVKGQVNNSTTIFKKLYEKLKKASDNNEKITIEIV